MPRIDVMTLLPWDQSKSNRAIKSTGDASLFRNIVRDYRERGDCILVLELDNGTEIGFAPEAGDWCVATHQFGEPSIATQLKKQPVVEPPPMPDWAPFDGPWCLKHWAPFNVPHPTAGTCLLSLGHEGDCRDQNGTWHNRNTSLLVGQSKNKASSEIEA